MANNMMKNLKASVSKDSLMNYGQAALAPLFSITVPSLLKVNGWLGYAVAYLVPAFIGAMLGWRGLTTGALTMAIGHLGYEMLDGPLNGIWDLQLSEPAAMNDYMGEMIPANAEVKYIDGQPMYVYPPALNNSMNDYITSEKQIMLDDYIMSSDYQLPTAKSYDERF